MDAAQLAIAFENLATDRAKPAATVTELLARHRVERKAVPSGDADRVRNLIVSDQAKLAALDAHEKEASGRVGDLSIAADLDGDADRKALASARRDLEEIRAQRVELLARIEAATKRITGIEADEAQQMRALLRKQHEELERAHADAMACNADRWRQLIAEINERVSSEIMLRNAAMGARSRAAG